MLFQDMSANSECQVIADISNWQKKKCVIPQIKSHSDPQIVRQGSITKLAK